MPGIADNYAPKDQNQYSCGKPQAPQYWINIEFNTEVAPRNKRERELVILHEAYRERIISLSLSLIDRSKTRCPKKNNHNYISSHGGRQSVTYVWRSRKKRRWVPAALAAGLEPLSMKTLVKHFNNSATLSHSRHHPELSETVPSNYSEKQTWPCVTSHSWHSLTIPVTVSILPSSKLTWLWKITIFNG